MKKIERHCCSFLFNKIIPTFACLFASAGCGLAMDQARVETQVDAAVATYGVTGRGVIVAVMDRGIDWRNNDFRNTNGSTRIAYIYDLTDDSGSNSPANPYHLGTLYTRAQIDGALSGGTNLVTRDAVGHGTTTAAIAAGNGRNLWKYRGVAYEATIIAVKIVAENVPAHGTQPAETAFYDQNRIPVAIQFVKDKAQELGMPAVMLLNLGSIGGPMDGTSSMCQMLNTNVGSGISGRIFVTGTSDDGGMPNHAEGTVTLGGTNLAKFHMGDPGPLVCDLWYSQGDRFDVTITTPNGVFGPYVSPPTDATWDNEVTSDFNYWQLGGTATFYGVASHKREIWVSLNGPTGDYTLTLKGTTITNGHFDASLNPSEFWNSSISSNYFTSDVVPGSTIWDLATASNNICPNDYVHRTNWVDIDGYVRWLGGEGDIGQLWLGTGVGPTHDGRVGVDVSAPGDSVFTTYNTNSYWATFRFNEIQDGGGLYGRASATSAANPIVTGIIALMLQANPQLDAPTVKRILHQSARADGFTGAVPNSTWGYGKVNALAAVGMAEPPPPLLSLSFTSGAQTALTLKGAVIGKSYALQVSSNLTSWTALLTNVAAATNFTLLDTNLQTSQRFYRAAVLP